MTIQTVNFKTRIASPLLLASLTFFILGCNPSDKVKVDDDTTENTLDPISAAECPKNTTPIAGIQGVNTVSPLNNQRTTTHGVVTEQRLGVDEGYFIQSIVSDDNPNTPEGIFILGNPQMVARGDWVKVSGKVQEKEGMTQLVADDVSLCGRNQPLPAAVPLSLPFSPLTVKTLESMRVSVENALITNVYNLARYGEITLGTRLRRIPSDQAIPLSEEFKALTDKNREFNLILEDNLSFANPDGISFLSNFSYNNRLKVGDFIKTEGVLFYHNHHYRISASQPQVTEILPQIERSLTERVPNALRIASFNLLNYFNGQHDTQGQGDFSRNARGATSQAEFELQEGRLVNAIQAIDADIVGLLELENDGFERLSAIQQLIDRLNQGQPTQNHYAFVKPANGHSLGSDRIAVGLIYRPQQLTPKGVKTITMPSQSLEGTVRRMRPSLVVDFTLLNAGADDKGSNDLRVVVNHFKSKGSPCWEDLNQPSQQDVIQGRCNALRVSAAGRLGHALSGDTSAPMQQVLLGDFNAYSYEDPIQLLTGYNAQFHPYLIKGAEGVAVAPTIPEKGFGFIAPAKSLDPKGFSYIYLAQAGSLDHILVSQSLAPKVTYLMHWNVNSIETGGFRPDALFEHFTSDYHREHYYQSGPHASSDHDPVIMDIRLK